MIRGVRVCHVSMPMQRAFGHAAATRHCADSVFVLVDSGDHLGVGESVPRPYVTGETIESVFAALASVDFEGLSARLTTSSFEAAVQSVEQLRLDDRLPGASCAACALELALLDAIGKRFARPVRDIMTALEPSRDAGLRSGAEDGYPISRVLDMTRSPDAFLAEGGPFHHVKIKVGGNPDHDRAVVRSARERLPPGTPISVDANMAWSEHQARAFVEDLQPCGIAWYEEPLARRQWPALSRLRRATGAKIMLDESFLHMADLRDASAHETCDLVNIRISKCGGLIPSLRLAEAAGGLGLGVQLGVQVGEMGPLWAAGRAFMACARAVVAYESGQADRWFAEQVFEPQPLVDRSTYLGRDLPSSGLGALRPCFEAHVVKDWLGSGSKDPSRLSAAREGGARR